jgi:hypothetical protein
MIVFVLCGSRVVGKMRPLMSLDFPFGVWPRMQMPCVGRKVLFGQFRRLPFIETSQPRNNSEARPELLSGNRQLN